MTTDKNLSDRWKKLFEDLDVVVDDDDDDDDDEFTQSTTPSSSNKPEYYSPIVDKTKPNTSPSSNPITNTHGLENISPASPNKNPLPTHTSSPSSSFSDIVPSKGDAVQPTIISHEYDLPSRTDLVSLQTNIILEHLKDMISLSDGNTDSVRIDTVVHPSEKWILYAYASQHAEMDTVVKRLHSLVKLTIESERIYHEVSVDSIKKLIENMHAVDFKRQESWLFFITILEKMLKKELDRVCNMFKKRIETLCRSLVVKGCIKMENPYESELNDFTEYCLKDHSVDKSFERMKQQAFQVFNNNTKVNIKSENDINRAADQVLGKLILSVNINVSADTRAEQTRTFMSQF
jgi:hypothetical protein